jgi:hypothetical protein
MDALAASGSAASIGSSLPVRAWLAFADELGDHVLASGGGDALRVPRVRTG